MKRRAVNYSSVSVPANYRLRVSSAGNWLLPDGENPQLCGTSADAGYAVKL